MKKVLITGGTRGIGRALAENLVLRGAEVFVSGSNPQLCSQLQTELGIRAFASDLSSHAGVRKLASVVRAELCGLDVLINNAGIQRNRDLANGIDADDVEKEIFLNFLAPVLLTNELLSPLLSSPQAAVVNISSGLALVPATRAPIYSASKAALSSYTRSLRAELRDSRILVTEVLPPVVQTEMNGGRRTDGMSPIDMAERISCALTLDQERLVVGKVRLLDWLSRLSPYLAFRIVSRM